MDIEALASLESQGRFCDKLVAAVESQESFILLSGDSGSGRTVVCEQVVNETDSKMRAVFIPCNRDMQLPRLRELFLQQLLPNIEFDPELNLADALAQVELPQDHRILVVVDDVDSVMGAFYNELLQLYEQFLGRDRFVFILVCHPLWAEEKLRLYTGKVEILQLTMPVLNMQESIVLSRHMFALNDTLRIYNAVANKLPLALARADGNLGKIIEITEQLMKEPDLAQQVSAERSTGDVRSSRAMPKRKAKKSNSVGIFVTVICIFIVLACLIPIFFGGSFFSTGEEERNVQPQVANEGALMEQSSLGFDQSSSQQQQQQRGPEYLLDDGILPEKIPEGIEAPSASSRPSHSVTLSGEELDKIEGGAHNSSAYPRGMEGSVVAPSAPAPRRLVLQREDNMNHPQRPEDDSTSTQIIMPSPQRLAPPELQQPAAQQQSQAEREALARASAAKLEADRRQAQEDAARQVKAVEEQKAKEAAARAKAEADRKAKAEAERKAAQKAEEERKAQQQAAAQVPVKPQPLRAGQIINLADEQKALEAQRRQQQAAQHQPHPVQPVAALGKGEGSMDELKSLAGARFTIQIVSASKRANIAAAARGLSDRYWIVESSRHGKPWYILVSGSYGSREEAQAAAKNIPSSVSQGAAPFIRRMSEVKSEIR